MRRAGLRIGFYGSSLVSAYWNGAATYYRGLIRALAERGHHVTFFEPDAYERQRHHEVYRLHKDLLRLRREEPALQPRDQRWFDGAALCDEAFFLRYFGPDEDQDRVLLVNLGIDYPMSPISAPLLAAPPGRRWVICWSSESSDYGGSGTPDLEMDATWTLLGKTALWLAPERPTGKEASHG